MRNSGERNEDEDAILGGRVQTEVSETEQYRSIDECLIFLCTFRVLSGTKEGESGRR